MEYRRNMCEILTNWGISNLRIQGEDFKNLFLQQSMEFYETESKKLLACNCMWTYMFEVTLLREKEIEIVNDYCNLSMKNRLLQDMMNILVKNNINHVLAMKDRDINYLLTSKNYESFKLIYAFFEGTPNCNLTVANLIKNCFHARAEALIQKSNILVEKNQIDLIEDLCELEDELYHFAKFIKDYDKELEQELKPKFKHIIQLNQERLVNCISPYISQILKKGLKWSDNEVITLFLKAMTILYKANAKVSFEQHYQQFKRLVVKLTPNVDKDKGITYYIQVNE